VSFKDSSFVLICDVVSWGWGRLNNSASTQNTNISYCWLSTVIVSLVPHT
jgi:hypothetical protein